MQCNTKTIVSTQAGPRKVEDLPWTEARAKKRANPPLRNVSAGVQYHFASKFNSFSRGVTGGDPDSSDGIGGHTERLHSCAQELTRCRLRGLKLSRRTVKQQLHTAVQKKKEVMVTERKLEQKQLQAHEKGIRGS
jgi:hypothetical protein